MLPKRWQSIANCDSNDLGAKPFIGDADRAKLIQDSFEFADEIGITPEILEQIDAVMLSRVPRTKSALEQWTVDMPLKGFEKTEWFVRSTAAHAVRRQFEGANAARAAAGKVAIPLSECSDGRADGPGA